MPINPEILLSGRPPAPSQSPMQFVNDLFDLRARGMQMQQASAQMAAAEKKRREDEMFGRIIQKRAQQIPLDEQGNPKGELDLSAVLYDLDAAGLHGPRMQLQDKMNEWLVQRVESDQKVAQTHETALNTTIKMAQGMTEANYPTFLTAAKKILAPEMAAMLPGQYDQKRLGELVSMGENASSRLEKQRFIYQQARDILGDLKDAQKDQAVWDKERPDYYLKTTKMFGGQLALADTPEEWNHYKELMNTFLAPIQDKAFKDSLAGQFSMEFSPEAKERARKLSVGPERLSVEQNENLNRAAAQESVTRQRFEQEKQDINDLADAVESGKKPPDFQRLYHMSAPLQAELSRRGFDITRAEEDWEATKRFLATDNGTRSVNLKRAVSFVKASLDGIEPLFKEWDSPTWGPLSKARLTLAAGGNLGQKAKSIATRLLAQVADMQSELGTVYKGGNSSTDESLRLAAENLKGDWDAQTAIDNLNQIRTNIKYRENSLANVRPSSLGDSNQYDPKSKGDPNVPPEVLKLGPGKHTFVNGQIWMVSPDGKSAVWMNKPTK